MFKVNNGNTRARCEICSKLTIRMDNKDITILKTGSKSIDLVLSGMSSPILGDKNDNDFVFLYTDFTGLV